MKHFTELTSEYLQSLKIKFLRGKSRSKKGSMVGNHIVTFDTETTSIETDDGKMALVYIWMIGFGVDGEVFYGRTIEDLSLTLDTISNTLGLYGESVFNTNEYDSKTLPVYVHNLGYDFQFLWSDLPVSNVFAGSKYNPFHATLQNGIQFRDSYVLLNASLDNAAKDFPPEYKIRKLTGSLDYKKVRHAETELTEEELLYCEYDIKVLATAIHLKIKEYDALLADISTGKRANVVNLPMTATSFAREYCYKHCVTDFERIKANKAVINSNSKAKVDWSSKNNHENLMKNLTLTKDCYLQLKETFAGGFTHGNPNYRDMTLRDVSSYDISSSYPSVMAMEKFPCHRPTKVDFTDLDELYANYNMNHHVFNTVATFTNLVNKMGNECYVQFAKCRNISANRMVFNGRVWQADSVTIPLTNVDLEIMSKFYEWDDLTIEDTYVYRAKELPRKFIRSILNLYKSKTLLKGVAGKEDEYKRSKALLNAIYGMCVMDIVKDQHKLVKSDEVLSNVDEDFISNIDAHESWFTEESDIDSTLAAYNSLGPGFKKRFTYYPWGVWVTAYARRNLFTAIEALGEDYIYSDTDSVKFFSNPNHETYFKEYNANIERKLIDVMAKQKLDMSLIKPTDENSVIGIWSYEGTYDMFKYIRAKQYMVKEGDYYEITVAGLKKDKGLEYLKEISDSPEDLFNKFTTGLKIPANRTGKLTHIYVNKPRISHITDYQGSTLKNVVSSSGVFLEDCPFELNESDAIIEFFEATSRGMMKLPTKIMRT